MEAQEHSPLEQEQRRRLRRRVVSALVVVMLLLALVLTPPLLNVSRLRRRIAANMSESLGRPVHLDKVSLHVLPVPGFTLENLVVSDDPSFGAEPVIRANSVRATVRVSSLWRRQVEFGTIHFDETTSVNLVRRADGRWNIETILLHAAQEDAAPTAQTKAGPAPRFPYIEATGARLNVKMGDEKMPLALTEADFALWLPSPQQWKVRLEAKPVRTDTYVTDTGLLSVEATLERAAQVADVPIELTAAWRKAPLGEATRVLTGRDAGWRGGVEATASLRGTLGDAVLMGNMKLDGVRRADFIPAKTLDLNAECTGHLSVTVALLREPTCTISPTPISRIGSLLEGPASVLYATADTVELTGLKATRLRLGSPGVSLAWLMDFARVWSLRIPAGETASGTVRGSLARTDGRWTGDLSGTIQAASLDHGPDGGRADREFTLTSDGSALTLSPFNLTFADKTALMLSGQATAQAANLRISGVGTAHQVEFLARTIPSLGEDVVKALPAGGAVSPVKLDIACTKPWASSESCAAVAEPKVVRRRRLGARPR